MVLQDIVNGLNNYAFQFVNSIANPTLNPIMQYFAFSIFIVVPLLTIYLYLRKDKNLFSFLTALIALTVLSETLKLLFREPRPCSLQSFSWINSTGCESGFALPSTHATALTGLYLFVDTYKYLRILYMVWLILILFDRVYLGLHYLTDIIAGIIISIIFTELINKHKKQINSYFADVAHRFFGPLFGNEWLK
jgi:undecaprenyl-diphosphatase